MIPSSPESPNSRAERIRENQRRCRERKLKYVTSLEGRIHDYEQRCVEADLKLQQRTRSLKVENEKLKTILTQSFGIDRAKIEEQGPEKLLQEITKFAVNGLDQALVDHQNHKLSTARDSDYTGGSDPVDSLVLTLNPDGYFVDAFGDELWQALQLSPPSLAPTTETVRCEISFDLLKRLIEEQDPTALESGQFDLKDGVLIARDGSTVTLAMLGKLLERLHCRNC